MSYWKQEADQSWPSLGYMNGDMATHDGLVYRGCLARNLTLDLALTCIDFAPNWVRIEGARGSDRSRSRGGGRVPKGPQGVAGAALCRVVPHALAKIAGPQGRQAHVIPTERRPCRC